jgi:hypothetical protein
MYIQNTASNYAVFLQTLERFPWNLQYVHMEVVIIHCYTPLPQYFLAMKNTAMDVHHCFVFSFFFFFFWYFYLFFWFFILLYAYITRLER